MARARKEPTLRDKLAAALRELGGIPFDHAKLMTADQIISLFQFNHVLYHAQDGSDEHWNLEPMFIRAHRKITAERDVPQIAKTRRISTEHEAFRKRMLTPRDERPPKRSRFGSRPFPKRSRS
jgi:hypothetical protein